MINNIRRASITVLGRVQRVFFRDSTTRKARKLNLTGWVKNESDGSVKIIAEGEEENLKKLIEWAKRGPLLAKVDGIDVKWLNGEREYNNFEIK